MSTKKFGLPVSGFVNGLNTEASVLNVLPSEFMDGTVNVELLVNGEVRRRRGADFIGESDAGGFLQALRVSTTAAETTQEAPAAVFVRLTAPNGNLVERIVIDLDNKFYVYEATSNALRNIDTPKQTLTRGTHASDRQKFAYMQFAVSGDKLFFAGKHINPGYLSVDTDNESLTVTYISAIIRDPNASALNSRVKNNGNWYDCIETHTSAASNEPGVGASWETFWIQNEGAIPTGTDAPAAWATATAYTSQFIKRYNKEAVVTDTDTFPETVEFFAGRLWLFGDRKNPNDALFTQVVERLSDLEKFHQFADPFDSNDPDLVDDDGGILSIQGAGLGKRLAATGSSIFLGTSTGVWQVTGPDGVFKATNFSSSRVLADPVLGAGNIVLVDNELLIFGEGGIWQSEMASTSAGDDAPFSSLSDGKVETLYGRIPKVNKASAVAVYNSTAKCVHYFYNEDTTEFGTNFNSDSQPGYFRNVLVIDTRRTGRDVLIGDQGNQLAQSRTVAGAFFKHELADTADTEQPFIAVPFTSVDVPAADEVVVDVAGAAVVDALGADVTVAGQQQAGNTVLFLALQRVTSGSVVTLNMAFGRMEGSKTRDWNSSSTYTTSYTSQILTGVQTMGDLLHAKAATYIMFLFKKVETGTLDENSIDTNPGGCFLRTAWQWSTNTTSEKYGAQRAIYIPDRFGVALAGAGLDGRNHAWFKHRARGRGQALQVVLENDGDKDFHLVGWSQQFYGKVN